LGGTEALCGVGSFRSYVSQPWGRLAACRQGGHPETVTQDQSGTDDCGLHYRHAVSHFLVVMDVLGSETSVTLCRTYRRIRRGTPVIRRLKRKKRRERKQSVESCLQGRAHADLSSTAWLRLERNRPSSEKIRAFQVSLSLVQENFFAEQAKRTDGAAAPSAVWGGQSVTREVSASLRRLQA
jgi:hypothetical protein